MTTKKTNTKEVYVKIDWTIFNQYKYLDEVPIVTIERDQPQLFRNGKSGTSIIVSNLRKEWQRGVARNVKRTITALTSPFESNDSFKPEFDIADKPGWFEGLLKWDDVKDFALFHFKVVLKDNSIEEFLYEFLPWASMPKLAIRKVDLTNDLVSNFSNLIDENGKEIRLEIGEVVFEGYIFDRDPFVLRLGVTDKKGFKDYLANNCGVRVFRDGPRVYDYGEPENDWLGLDIRRVNEPAKRLSNNLILRAVYLHRKDSFQLIEKTNREGFVENAAYETFKGAILHSLNIIEILRFSDKQKLRQIYGPTPKSEPVLQVLGDLKEFVDNNVKDAEVKKEITRHLVKIEDDYKRINETLPKAAGAGLSMSVVIHEVEKIILEVEKVLKSEHASERAINLVKHLSSLIDGYSEIIRKSTQTNEDLKEVIDQALFNTEFRLASHKIEVIRAYMNYKGQSKTKIARSLFIGSLMNVIDNSIYWLEKNGRPDKKIYINIFDELGFVYVVIADNGTGFLLPTEEITEPFVSAKPGGMGLGLHIANEIMVAHNGRLLFPDWGDFELPQEFRSGAVLSFGFKK